MEYEEVLKQVCFDFNLVYQPSPELRKIHKRRRFLISPRMLHEYVGPENAYKANKRAFDTSEDKLSIKLRKYGKLDFYTK